MEKIPKENISIIADFDGTITNQDTNGLLISHFGSAQNQEIERLYKDNIIGAKEALERHFTSMRFSEEEYQKYLSKEVNLDPHFKSFHKKIKEKKIAFKIVSGGFINSIKLILENEGINESEVYANRLDFQDEQLNLQFYHDLKECNMPFKVCGLCKLSFLEREGQRCNIFIGDGLTDRCMALKAELVFAKDGLAKFCEQEKINYIEFSTFQDIIGYLNL